MPDVDVSLSFAANIGTELAIGSINGEDSTGESCAIDVTFDANIDTSHAVLATRSVFGVSFTATVFDPNARLYERGRFAVSFQASIDYVSTPSAPQPDLPSGPDITFVSYFGQPVMPLCLVPSALGQPPSAQIVYDLATRIVRSQTHMEQRMNMNDSARRTYTFDYVVYPSQQTSILHIMENCDRFPVMVPLFPEMYRFDRNVPVGSAMWRLTAVPEYNLYEATHVMVVDGARKTGDVYAVTGVGWNYDDGEVFSYVEVDPGAIAVHPGGRCAMFPCLIGWVDSFEPEYINKRTLAGSLTVREHMSGVSPCYQQE